MTLPKLNQKGARLRGFTLVELLIATLCFAIILAALNSTFYSAMHLRTRTVKAVEITLPLNQALSIIRRDLQGLMMPSTNSTGTFRGPLTTEPQGVMAGLVSGPNGLLQFCTTTGVLTDDPFKPLYWGEAQEVAYYLKAPEFRNSSGLDLVRGVVRNLLPVVTNLSDLTETRLLGGVQSMLFSFWDGTNWQTYWDSTQVDPGAPAVPQLIKISLTFTPQSGDSMTYGPLDIEVPVLIDVRTNRLASRSAATTTTTTGGAIGASSTGRGSTGSSATGRGSSGGGSSGRGSGGSGSTGRGSGGGGSGGGGGARPGGASSGGRGG